MEQMDRLIFRGRIIIVLGVFASLLVLLWGGNAHAADVTLTWNTPDDSRVVGYNIYYGTTSWDFLSPKINIESADQTSCVITDLSEGVKVDFGATSVADNDNESDMSEIISYFVMKYKPKRITLEFGE